MDVGVLDQSRLRQYRVDRNIYQTTFYRLNITKVSIKFTMKSFIYIPEISIYIFINIKISIKWCKNVEFLIKNALQTCKYNIRFKIVEKVSKYEKNNTIHNGCWRYGTE